MGIAMFLYGVFIPVRYIILKYFNNRPILRKIYPLLRSHNVEITTIRFVLEGTMDILFWALISILYVKDTRSLGLKASDRFSNVFAFSMLLVIMYAPVHAIYRVVQLHRLLNLKKGG
jgi:hypothetical protein